MVNDLHAQRSERPFLIMNHDMRIDEHSSTKLDILFKIHGHFVTNVRKSCPSFELVLCLTAMQDVLAEELRTGSKLFLPAGKKSKVG